MKIKMIYACDRDGYIGKDNKLLFSIPGDMERFMKLTMHHVVVMGRRTWESLPAKRRPLVGRVNAIISSTLNQREVFKESALTFRSVTEFLNFVKTGPDSKREIWVIGGGEIYRQFMPIADEIYMTVLNRSIGGDTVAPCIPMESWRLKEQSENFPFENTTYRFVTYERIHHGNQGKTSD